MEVVFELLREDPPDAPVFPSPRQFVILFRILHESRLLPAALLANRVWQKGEPQVFEVWLLEYPARGGRADIRFLIRIVANNLHPSQSSPPIAVLPHLLLLRQIHL